MTEPFTIDDYHDLGLCPKCGADLTVPGGKHDPLCTLYLRYESETLPPGRTPLAEAVISALNAYGEGGNGEGWTIDHDVIGTLWNALTPEEKARTGYDVAAMDMRQAGN